MFHLLSGGFYAVDYDVIPECFYREGGGKVELCVPQEESFGGGRNFGERPYRLMIFIECERTVKDLSHPTLNRSQSRGTLQKVSRNFSFSLGAVKVAIETKEKEIVRCRSDVLIGIVKIKVEPLNDLHYFFRPVRFNPQ